MAQRLQHELDLLAERSAQVRPDLGELGEVIADIALEHRVQLVGVDLELGRHHRHAIQHAPVKAPCAPPPCTASSTVSVSVPPSMVSGFGKSGLRVGYVTAR
jgi:hypothetical protein